MTELTEAQRLAWKATLELKGMSDGLAELMTTLGQLLMDQDAPGLLLDGSPLDDAIYVNTRVTRVGEELQSLLYWLASLDGRDILARRGLGMEGDGDAPVDAAPPK